MSRKRRKAGMERQRQLRKRRTAVGRDGDMRVVTQHNSTKGFDVEMVRDFLDQLLLELRVQHYENLQLLHVLKEIEGPGDAMEDTTTSPELVAQLRKYMVKYETTLLFMDVIDGSNATREEIRAAQMAVLDTQTKLRDEQIGHMEALQELFNEAILCAKTPFEIYADGTEARPTKNWQVREMVDSCIETPDFDELAAVLKGHPFTTQTFLDQLKPAEIIVAVNESFVKPVLLFGRVKGEAVAAGRVSPGMYCCPIPVNSPEELQFLVATIAKYKGRHDYRGNYYDEF